MIITIQYKTQITNKAEKLTLILNSYAELTNGQELEEKNHLKYK